ncbi:hypothetical protein P40081_01035 [Paenibacillus sp. FSL P4-0081]|jgi:hypothetical protein|uniref:hypothetical protein n=1 Tax=Paenibacillus sp. FSL P4-0081 TaxID=1536769 RepID=UPI0004F816B0|nr:hypothetical protein [Paenibacillus sp. FSL P4-0081]AIQ26947.1 hypothetical protein P40081_01035 [Paenibacillus sp. FSL P4-0081]
MAMVWVQGELFPRADKMDKLAAKSLLSEYPKMRKAILNFERKETLTIQEETLFNNLKYKVQEIDAALELILDDDVKAILKHRYFTARKHHLTLETFGATNSTATINRRIDVGVRTIAECLKLSGMI